MAQSGKPQGAVSARPSRRARGLAEVWFLERKVRRHRAAALEREWGEFLTLAQYSERHEKRRCWQWDTERVRRLAAALPSAALSSAFARTVYTLQTLCAPRLLQRQNRSHVDPHAQNRSQPRLEQ